MKKILFSLFLLPITASAASFSFIAGYVPPGITLPALVQSSCTPSGVAPSQTSNTLTFSANVATGDMVAVPVAVTNTSTLSNGDVTDNYGNPYTPYPTAGINGTNIFLMLFVSTNVKGGQNFAVTAQADSMLSSHFTMCTSEFSVVKSSDVSVSNTNVSISNPNSGIFTTNFKNELCLGAITSASVQQDNYTSLQTNIASLANNQINGVAPLNFSYTTFSSVISSSMSWTIPLANTDVSLADCFH